VNRERFKALLAEYSGVALGTYLGIFFLVLAGFALAISAGVEVEGAASGAGLLAAAWVATKLTQPLRIAATVVLTPFVARLLRRQKRPANAEPASPPEAGPGGGA
jgi:membrane protein implicated in regulation of membrane protease activity